VLSSIPPVNLRIGVGETLRASYSNKSSWFLSKSNPKRNNVENYKLTNDDIQFISERMVALQHSKSTPFNAEEVARELMASLICCSVKNGG
jgi:hypothetical protein